jgi:predicted transcriptional regulator
MYLSESYDIPLSTLKFNVKALFEEGLVRSEGTGEPVVLTSSGKAFLQNHDNELIK